MSFVGIDVSKKELVLFHWERKISWKAAQTPQGWAEVLTRLQELKVERIALEATGAYERGIADVLARAGMHVLRLNPRMARDLAKGMGYLAKTDRVDAKVLAEIASIRPNHPRWAPPTLADDELRQLVEWRLDLVESGTQEKNRLQMATSKFVQRSINLLIKQLDKAIDKVEKEIKARIKDQPELNLDAELLDAEKGVGWITAVSLLILLPEIGSATRGQISLLAGLAPIANDSGEQRGKRHIRGGRKAARTALYMATLTATTYNPDIAAFYRRLKETKGKESKVALTAAMRKLLVRLNAKLRDARERRRGEDLPKTA